MPMPEKSLDFEQFNQQGKGVFLEGEITRDGDSSLTLRLSGFLDNENSRYFLKEATSILKQHDDIEHVVLDLKKLNYISSTGIGAFMRLLTQAKKNGETFYLKNVSSKIKSVITMLGFISFFTIIDDTEEENV